MSEQDYDTIEDKLQAELDDIAQEIELLREQKTLVDNPTAEEVADELLTSARIDGLEARLDSLQGTINGLKREIEDV